MVRGAQDETNLAHASTSLTLICTPFMVSSADCVFSHVMKRTIAADSSALLIPQLSSNLRISATMRAMSSPLLALGIHISVKRDRRAGLNSRLPKSPPGFIVARNLKFLCAVIFSDEAVRPPFSARVISRPDSSTLFNRSITASSAKLISSSTNMSPSFIACTRGPSCHSNRALDRCQYPSASAICSLSASMRGVYRASLPVGAGASGAPPLLLSLLTFFRGTGEMSSLASPAMAVMIALPSFTKTFSSSIASLI